MYCNDIGRAIVRDVYKRQCRGRSRARGRGHHLPHEHQRPCPVSYTHLDVYKRQHLGGVDIEDAGVVSLALEVVALDNVLVDLIACLLYTSRCV